MRSIVSSGLIALALASLAACGKESQPQPPRDPVANDLQQHQTPATTPSPQEPNDPTATNGKNHSPRDPSFETAGPQSPTWGAGAPQEALTDPGVQKPFYTGNDSFATGENKALAKTERPLNDREILGVVLAVNEDEVTMAEQAAKKGTNADVKAFAVMMKTHHTQGVTKTKAIVAKTKITAGDSDLESYLAGDAAKTMKDLRDKSGADFDKSYIDAQVSAHKAVLTAIDNRLSPSASNAEVRSLVVDTRRIVTEHLAKAEDIQQKLGAATTSNAIDTAAPAKKPAAKPAVKSEDAAKARAEKALEPRP